MGVYSMFVDSAVWIARLDDARTVSRVSYMLERNDRRHVLFGVPFRDELCFVPRLLCITLIYLECLLAPYKIARPL
jgi:hypothetical protein